MNSRKTEKFIAFCKEFKIILHKHKVKELGGCRTCLNNEKLFARISKDYDFQVLRRVKVLTYYPQNFKIIFTEQLSYDLNESEFKRTQKQEIHLQNLVKFLKDFEILCIKHNVWSEDNTSRYIKYKPKSEKSKNTKLYYYEEVEKEMKEV